jgi:hypothetical protein
MGARLSEQLTPQVTVEGANFALRLRRELAVSVATCWSILEPTGIVELIGVYDGLSEAKPVLHLQRFQ